MIRANDPLAGMSPQVFTDLGSLQNLPARARGDKAAALAEVARQFESLMLQMMMKSMRDANAVFAEGNPLASSEMEFYQEMFDQQLTLTLAQGGGMGLAQVLERQLGGQPGTATLAQQGNDDSLQRKQVLASMRGLHGDPAMERLWEKLAAAPLPAEVDRAGAEIDASARPDTGFAADPAEFVTQVAPLARQAAGELGVDARVLISQAALETGWGRKMLAHSDGRPSYNFFNIKAGRSWQGPVVTVPTLEYRDGVAVREHAAFRAYASPAEGFADYVQLIRDNPRYQEALQQAGSPRSYMQALADAGYATDPHYADKVMKVFATEHIGG